MTKLEPNEAAQLTAKGDKLMLGEPQAPLLPCPFCGAPAELGDSGSVTCQNLNCSVICGVPANGYRKEHDPIAIWNTRAPASDLEITKAEIMAIGDTVMTLRKMEHGAPVAYACFTDNGNIRLWSTRHAEIEAWAKTVGRTVTPLYRAPALSSSEVTIQARREAYEDAAKICERIEINAERRAADHISQSPAQNAAYDKAEAASQCKRAIRERIEGLHAPGASPSKTCECGFSTEVCATNPCMRKKVHLAGMTPDSKWPDGAPIGAGVKVP